MSEDYTLMTALKNIKDDGLVKALKKDLAETAERYPAWTIAACLLYNKLLDTDSGVGGFAISPRGRLKHLNKELYSDGVWE